MKVIDEKGRLFGIINIIDFLVISFLAFLIPIFYYGYTLFTKRTACLKEANQKDFGIIEVNCDLINLNQEILRLIMVGDVEINKNRKVIGKIIWIGESQPIFYIINPERNKSFKAQDVEFRKLPIKLKIEVGKNNQNLYYNDQRIADGQFFYFRTRKYTVKAILVQKNENSGN